MAKNAKIPDLTDPVESLDIFVMPPDEDIQKLGKEHGFDESYPLKTRLRDSLIESFGKVVMPSDEDIKKLGKEYGFDESYPLQIRLKDFFINARVFRSLESQTAPPSVHKRVISNLRNRCESLHEALEKLGMSEKELLIDCWPESILKSFLLLEEHSQKVYWAADGLLQKLNKVKGSRRKNGVIWDSVIELADIYSQGTGKEPKTYWADADGQYEGEFYRFVLACAELGGISLSPQGADPGRTMINVLKKWKKDKTTRV